MDISNLAIKLLLLLLPGITTALIVDQLTVHKPWVQFRFLLYSFVLGIADYLFLQIWYYLKYWIGLAVCPGGHLSKVAFWDLLLTDNTALNAKEVLFAGLAGVALGLLVSKAIQSKALFKFAAWFSISEKYGDENLFSFFLNAKEVDWLYVRDFKNKVMYRGLRTGFSEVDEVREIVLSQVTVYNMEDGEVLFTAPNIYLSFDIGSLVIEQPEKGGTNGG